MFRKLAIAILLMTASAWAQQEEDTFVGQKAPEFGKAEQTWINSAPLKLEQLRGKVVLIEFWARECPFCAEALPYVNALHEKYSAGGLVVVGVHTPRFDDEKNIPKVKEAVAAKGIKYPVVTDNDYAIWTDYLCAAWPSAYVVDQEGVIQLNHSGVGRYEEIEEVIQRLLKKNSAK
jgi:thiol-disulfide isomerase/thioredoxin